MDDASPHPRGRVLVFAYDGSLNGDWVAHYAVRFARNRQLRAGLAPHRFGLDSGVVVSDDTPREILLSAARHRSRLVCLGASRRTLPRRLLQGSLIEAVLRDAPSDVAVYRSVD